MQDNQKALIAFLLLAFISMVTLAFVLTAPARAQEPADFGTFNAGYSVIEYEGTIPEAPSVGGKR